MPGGKLSRQRIVRMLRLGPFADKARPYPVQRLQIELLIGLGWGRIWGLARTSSQNV
jgi:hypothetical protein